MPVFVVHPGLQTIHASPPPCDQHPSSEPVNERGDVWQRIGTAFARSQGGWEVFINVVPLSGRFVVRPPEAGETLDAIPLERR